MDKYYSILLVLWCIHCFMTFRQSEQSLTARMNNIIHSCLQTKELSAAEGQQVASLAKATLRSDSSFSLFWQVIIVKAQKLNIGKPTLPRKQTAPKRFEVGDRSS